MWSVPGACPFPLTHQLPIQAFRTSRFLVSPVAEHKVIPGLETEDGAAAGVAQKQQQQQQQQQQQPMDSLTPSLVPLPDESPQSSSIPASSTAALLPSVPTPASIVPPTLQEPQVRVPQAAPPHTSSPLLTPPHTSSHLTPRLPVHTYIHWASFCTHICLILQACCFKLLCTLLPHFTSFIL